MNATQPHALEDFETFLEEEGVLKPTTPNFVNLAPYLSGDFVQERPSVAEVLPGRSLFYAGRLNEIHGEPGEGKSNVAITAMNHILAQGGSVLFIDPEDTPQGFSNRALGLGGDAAAILERVHYLHNPAPGSKWSSNATCPRGTPRPPVRSFATRRRTKPSCCGV